MYKNYISLEIFHHNKHNSSQIQAIHSGFLFNNEINEQIQARNWFQPTEEIAQLKDLSLSKSNSYKLRGKELPYQDLVIP